MPRDLQLQNGAHHTGGEANAQAAACFWPTTLLLLVDHLSRSALGLAMPQGHFARAGAGAGVNGLAKNNPEAYNPGKERTALENVYGRGWRYCAPTIDNIGMPGRVKGRPAGGGMRLHPNVDSTTPFPVGEGTSGGPIQDPGRTYSTKHVSLTLPLPSSQSPA